MREVSEGLMSLHAQRTHKHLRTLDNLSRYQVCPALQYAQER